MKSKFLLLILGLVVSVGYSQAQEITNVRQDGDKLILDYKLPHKAASVKFYYKYQSESKSNLIGEAKKLSAGSGSYIWDLSKTNTVLTGENMSFSLDAKKSSTNVYVMASGLVNVGLRVGLLFNNHGFYVAPGLSLDDGTFGCSAGYAGKYQKIGWYAGAGCVSEMYYVPYNEHVSWAEYTFMLEFGVKYYIIDKIPISVGMSFDESYGPFPQFGVGYLF